MQSDCRLSEDHLTRPVSQNTYRLAGVHVGDVTLQPLHSPVEEAVDGLVFILLVGGLNDQRDRTIKSP